MSPQSKPSNPVVVPTKTLGSRPKAAFVPAKNISTNDLRADSGLAQLAKKRANTDPKAPGKPAGMRRENTPQARNEANLQSVTELAYVKKQVSQLKEQVAKLQTELEVERMRVVACGVGALSNTSNSIKERLSQGHPYYCASVGDVYNAVDREIALREFSENLAKWDVAVKANGGVGLPDHIVADLQALLKK